MKHLHRLVIGLWAALVFSLLAWISAGYPWPLCLIGALPLLAPLRGLIQGRRRTYAWATLFAVPYFAFGMTELLVNRDARIVATASLLLIVAWFSAMVLYLRCAPARPG